MREAIYAVGLLLAVAMQTSVAPLFRAAGAEASIVLLFVLLVLIIEGPKPAMVAAPAAGVLYAFAAGLSPALVLVGTVPLVLVAAWLEDIRLPVARFALVAAVFVIAGLWLRLVLATGAIIQGSDAALWELVSRVLIPGALLDLSLLAVAYLPIRLVGFEPREMSLGASRY